MKAIRVDEFGAPEVMRLQEVEDPKPGPGQVVVRVQAAGVNPVDTYIRTGTYAFRPSLPYTPGSDAAGIVEATGDGVAAVEVGDRVYTTGTLSGAYAEKTLCAEAQVHPLPAHLTFAQGAAIGVPYPTAYRAIFYRAHGLPGETLLIHGASGGVGTASVQLASAAGLRVIGTSGTAKGRQLILDQGAEHAFDHHDPAHFEEILRLTGGKGVDVIIEMLANVNLGRDLGILAQNGRVVVVGSRGTVEINPREIMARDAAIIGMVLTNADDLVMARIHSALAAGLWNGTLRPVIGLEVPLSEAPRSHHEVMGPAAYGKIVLVP